MNDGGHDRSLPQITMAAPPTRSARYSTAIGVQFLLLLWVAGITFLRWRFGHGVGAGPLIMAMLALPPFYFFSENRFCSRMRARICAQKERHRPDALRDKIEKLWRWPGRPPKLEDITSTSEWASGADSTRPQVIALGVADIPEPTDRSFEPHVVSPGARFSAVWLAMAMSVVAALTWIALRAYASSIPSDVMAFVGTFAVAAPVLALYGIWTVLLHPTYARFAPGVVQILHCRSWKRRPTVRSYPVSAGTVVLAVRHFWGFNFTIARGAMKDGFAIWVYRKPDNAEAAFWNSLLSTAPTPPLSEEELVG